MSTILDSIDEGEVENWTRRPKFKEEVLPLIPNFKKVSLTDQDIEKIEKFVLDMEAKKKNEGHIKRDGKSLKKRLTTGHLGQMALGKYLGKDIIDWRIGESYEFDEADLKCVGYNIGVKTLNFDDFPLVHKNPKRPEVMCLVEFREVYICGIATIPILKKYVNDDRRRDGNAIHKTAFYGFKHLEDISTLDKYKI